MPITLEKSYNPDLIIIIKPYGKISNDDLKLYIENIDQHLENGKEFRCIYDLRKIEHVPPNIVHKISKHMKTLKKIENMNIICNVLIIESTTIKNLINVLLNIIEPMSPCYIINKVEDINKYLYKEHQKITA